MTVVVVVTAFPVPEHRAEVIAAFEAAIARGHGEPGVELYALHEGHDRLVMIEKFESQQARSEHAQGAALAGLRSALADKLSSGLTRRSSYPTRPETRRWARCERSPVTRHRTSTQIAEASNGRLPPSVARLHARRCTPPTGVSAVP
jgi:quinol monooxygenase YgiN